MKVYHLQVFDEVVEGTTAVYTDPSFNEQLAMTEKIELFALVDTVSGTTPILTVRVEESGDGIHFRNKSTGVPEINGATTAVVPVPPIVGYDLGTNLGSGYVRLAVTIGTSGTLKAHVRIWATGRGEG